MNKEGVGQVAPAPIKIVLSVGEMVEIVRAANQRARFRNYNGSGWRGGLKQPTVIEGVGEVSQKVRPVVAGLAGEYGTALVLNRRLKRQVARVDLLDRTFGDGGVDLDVLGASLQIKTRQSHDRRSLVRAKDERRAVVLHPVHAFVFCEWLGNRTVSVLGWIGWRAAVDRKLVDSVAGDWLNLEILDTELEPICAMIDGLQKKLIERDAA